MTSPAIVLRTGKYADDRLIVETYTEKAGPQTFIVRISHGGRSTGVRHTLFQPLALVELQWDEHTRAQLIKPKAARSHFIPATFHADPAKTALVFFMAEFLRAVLRTEPCSPVLFNYVENALRWLDAATDRSVANFHITFLIRITRLLGIEPTADEIDQVCPAQYRSAVPQLMRISLANQHLYRFTRTQRADILRAILLYYRLHQAGFPELKSVEVLTEMFD